MTDLNLKYAFFGHHKCATTWVSSILYRFQAIKGYKGINYHNSKMFNENLWKSLKTFNIDVLHYTNANYEFAKEIIPHIKGFHVVRDPRDIIVSAYFSHLKSHPTNQWPELVDYRKQLEKVSKEEGIFMEIDYREGEMRDIKTWNYNEKNVLELKMEDIISSPYQKMYEVFVFLEAIDMSAKYSQFKTNSVHESFALFLNNLNRKIFKVKNREFHLSDLFQVVFENSFQKKSEGRKLGQENINSHYRKGVHGDWVNHLTKEHIKIIKEKYNDVILQLGYEREENWEKNYGY